MKTLKFLLLLLSVTGASMVFGQTTPVESSSAQHESLKTVKLYPNPAVEYLSVKFETPQAKKVKLNVHNIIGSEMPLESEVVDDYEVHIKVKDFTTGVYLLSIHNEETGAKNAFKFLKK